MKRKRFWKWGGSYGSYGTPTGKRDRSDEALSVRIRPLPHAYVRSCSFPGSIREGTHADKAASEPGDDAEGFIPRGIAAIRTRLFNHERTN